MEIKISEIVSVKPDHRYKSNKCPLCKKGYNDYYTTSGCTFLSKNKRILEKQLTEKLLTGKERIRLLLKGFLIKKS